MIATSPVAALPGLTTILILYSGPQPVLIPVSKGETAQTQGPYVPAPPSKFSEAVLPHYQLW